MARDDLERLTQEWRSGVMSSLATLDRKLDETTRSVTDKIEITRHEIVDLKLAAVRQEEMALIERQVKDLELAAARKEELLLLERRIKELEEYKTKMTQTLIVIQVILTGAWALITQFLRK